MSPSTQRKVKRLFASRHHNLNIFRSRLPAALLNGRAEYRRNQRYLRNANALLRRRSMGIDTTGKRSPVDRGNVAALSKMNLSMAAFYSGMSAIRCRGSSSALLQNDQEWESFGSDCQHREKTMLAFARRVFEDVASTFSLSPISQDESGVSTGDTNSSENTSGDQNSAATVPIYPFVHSLEVLMSCNIFARAVLPPALAGGRLKDSLDSRVLLSHTVAKREHKREGKTEREKVVDDEEQNLSRVTWRAVRECMLSSYRRALDVDETFALMSTLRILPKKLLPDELKSLSVELQLRRATGGASHRSMSTLIEKGDVSHMVWVPQLAPICLVV